jgi:hypothetical protein
MANPKIQVDITADAKGLKKGAKEAGENLEKLGDEAAKTEKDVKDLGDKADKAGKDLDDLGDKAKAAEHDVEDLGDKSEKTTGKLEGIARSKAGEHLGVIGDAADALGVDLDNVDTKLMAAGAAIGAGTKLLVDGVQAWGEYVHQVEQYADSAGISTEAASQFAQVFKQFGVEADDGIDALKTLAEEVGDAPEKFKQYSVEIVRAKDGSVDLAATMGNVAERFRTMTDPAQRAAMGAALFGDNWLRIAPLLEKGKKGMDDLLSSVDESLIINDEAIRQQREFEQATNELRNAWQGLQLAIGRDALPRLTMLAKDLAKVSDATSKLTGSTGLLDTAMGVFNPIVSLYNARIADADRQAEEAAKSVEGMTTSVAAAGVEAASSGRKAMELADAEQEAADKASILKDRQDDMARSAQDAARSVEEHRKQLDLLNGTVQTVAGTKIAYERATMAVSDAEADLAEKQQAVTDAVNQFGQDSPEATKASNDYAKSLLDAESAADAQAQAAVNLAEQTAIASGQTFTAEQANIVYRDALNKVRDSANDPNLKDGLGGVVGLVDDTARSAGEAARQLDAAEAAARRLAAVAAGVGTTSSGAIVGSADRIEGAIDRQSFGRQSTAGIGATRETAGAQPVTIVVNSPIGRPNDVVQWMREELRRAERARR